VPGPPVAAYLIDRQRGDEAAKLIGEGYAGAD